MPREYKRITYEDRIEIEKLCKEKVPVKYIAQLLNISQQSVRMELKRCDEPYSADEAQKQVGKPLKIK